MSDDYKVVSAKSNDLVVCESEDYLLSLRRRHDKVKFGLWLVSHDKSVRYVLAENAQGAIGQTCPYDYADGRRQDFENNATAVRLPLHIRGWGSTTF